MSETEDMTEAWLAAWFAGREDILHAIAQDSDWSRAWIERAVDYHRRHCERCAP